MSDLEKKLRTVKARNLQSGSAIKTSDGELVASSGVRSDHMGYECKLGKTLTPIGSMITILEKKCG